MAADTQALASPSPAGAPRETERLRRAKAALAREKRRNRLLLLAPALVTIGCVGLLPLTVILVYSFLEPGTYGGVNWVFSGEAYVQFLFERDLFEETLSFNPAYLEIFGRSLLLALGATFGALLVGFPTAYFIATRPPGTRNLWLFLITLPFWTNLLIRTYAMMLILRDEGVINIALMEVGVISEPMILIYTDGAVLLGLVYSYLPFMVLPIYAALEKLDFRLVEAAYDLYATRFRVLRHVILPVAKPGIVAGCILVFIPGLGAYITPQLLGGGKSLMIGNMIWQQFGASRNWPFGSASALILMAIVMIALLIYVRYAGRKRAHG